VGHGRTSDVAIRIATAGHVLIAMENAAPDSNVGARPVFA
jgi:hypothetical protein